MDMLKAKTYAKRSFFIIAATLMLMLTLHGAMAYTTTSYTAITDDIYVEEITPGWGGWNYNLTSDACWLGIFNGQLAPIGGEYYWAKSMVKFSWANLQNTTTNLVLPYINCEGPSTYYPLSFYYSDNETWTQQSGLTGSHQIADVLYSMETGTPYNINFTGIQNCTRQVLTVPINMTLCPYDADSSCTILISQAVQPGGNWGFWQHDNNTIDCGAHKNQTYGSSWYQQPGYFTDDTNATLKLPYISQELTITALPEPVYHYTFDNYNLLDSSVNGNDGENEASLSYVTGYRGDYALDLTASDAYFDTPAVTTGGGASFAFFMYLPVSQFANMWNREIGGSDSGGAIGVGFTDPGFGSNMRTWTGTANQNLFSYSNLTLYHIVMNWASGNFSFYLNGSLTYTSSGFSAFQTSSSGHGFGATAFGGNNFTGIIDDVWFFNQSLSETEIQTLYVGNYTPQAPEEPSCVENWTAWYYYPGGCSEIGDWMATQQYIAYNDTNNCGTYDDLPVDNGTGIAFANCTEGQWGYSSVDSISVSGPYMYLNFSKPLNVNSNSRLYLRKVTNRIWNWNSSDFIIPYDCWDKQPLQLRIYSNMTWNGTYFTYGENDIECYRETITYDFNYGPWETVAGSDTSPPLALIQQEQAAYGTRASDISDTTIVYYDSSLNQWYGTTSGYGAVGNNVAGLVKDVYIYWYVTDCQESWTPSWDNNTCDTHDQVPSFLTFTDSNACGTVTDLPKNSNTYPLGLDYSDTINATWYNESCNYCTEDVTQFNSTCYENNTLFMYWTDSNYSTCCQTTGLESDCTVDTYINGTSQPCTYVGPCVPNWLQDDITHIEDCLSNTTYRVITNYYDSNSCDNLTGLPGDNGTITWLACAAPTGYEPTYETGDIDNIVVDVVGTAGEETTNWIPVLIVAAVIIIGIGYVETVRARGRQ